ncbi:hypothetical protein Cni_G02158 [Canna indica]|uniref:Uncharacterized protein n=1 Tax=Canna indica TaxID=4628 RepID=A0AAQ3Q1X1_9LILI|nr:hypothetical protein Cni_G02158 [Canna indica]
MKRNRAELAPERPKQLPEFPTKLQRRAKEKAVPEKQLVARGEEGPLAAKASAAAEPSVPPAAALEAEGAVGWDGAAEFGGGVWWWGVEEEKLLGWFPFADEDFLCCEEDRGDGVLLWEDDGHDIWQLQRIHEIPNAGKQ